MGPIVGIDLGTTSSLIAWVNPKTGLPECFPAADGSVSCPSIVSVDSEGRVVVGEAARHRLLTHPERTIGSVKRLLARTGDDLGGNSGFPLRTEGGACAARIWLGERRYTATELAAFVLREMKSWAEMCVGRPIWRAAVSVPANFSHAQRLATRDAAQLAGFVTTWLPSDPGVAALAWGALQRTRGTIAVCDFGGGSFDTSIVRVTSDEDGRPACEVLATRGDTSLGGDDMDDALLEMARREIRRVFGEDLAGQGEAIQELRKTLARAKHELSIAHETQVHYPLGKAGLYVRAISRLEFEGLIAPLVARASRCAQNALAEVEVTEREVDELILLGNCSRIPLVRRAMAQVFGREPRATVEGGQMVALGASLWAANVKEGEPQGPLRDVAPRAISVVPPLGSANVIIPCNAKLPASARRTFKAKPGRGCAVTLIEDAAEAAGTAEARVLARVRLRGAKLKRGGRGESRTTAEAQFLLDTNGILRVFTPAEGAAEWSMIEVRPACCISRKELDRMMVPPDGRHGGKTADRELSEARLLAEDVLQTTTNQMADPRANALAKEEREAIAESAARLRVTMLGNDSALIDQRVADLRCASARLQRLFDEAVSAKRQAAG